MSTAAQPIPAQPIPVQPIPAQPLPVQPIPVQSAAVTSGILRIGVELELRLKLPQSDNIVNTAWTTANPHWLVAQWLEKKIQ